MKNRILQKPNKISIDERKVKFSNRDKFKVERLSNSEKKLFRLLKNKKERNQTGRFLIEGYKLVYEALIAGFPIENIFISDDLLKNGMFHEIIDIAYQKEQNYHIIKDSDIRYISSLKNPEGIVAIGKLAELPDKSLEKALLPALYLWEINDPGNLGTIFRTASWFGVNTIIISPGSVDCFSPKVVRGSMGAIFRLNIFEKVQINQLREYAGKVKAQLFCADMDGEIVSAYPNNNWILVFGNEARGVPREIKMENDSIIKIPKKGYGESLNLGVSVGILLSELTK